jgi:hypothetical protein
MKQYGFKVNDNLDDNIVCQAYADDILLFAEGYDNIRKLLDTLNSYLVFAQISLNPSKCEVFKSKKDRYDSITLNDPLSGESKVIECKSI